MCKIMMMAGIKPSKAALAWKWSFNAAPLLTKHDSDGFGYAAVGDGEIFGERWLNPKDAFKNRATMTRAERYTRGQFRDAVSLEDSYNRFGRLTANLQAIMLHARMATCEKGLQNTHPFVHKDEDGDVTHALIHNGVISNAAMLSNRTSTCDSECILNEYGDSGVARVPENIQDVADVLRGYYACGVLTNDGTQQVMDVFKSERASLYVSWVPALGTHVFCTSVEILRATAKKTRVRLAHVAKVNEGKLLRMSVASGRCLSVTGFDDSGFTETAADLKDWITKSGCDAITPRPILAASRNGR